MTHPSTAGYYTIEVTFSPLLGTLLAHVQVGLSIRIYKPPAYNEDSDVQLPVTSV